MEPRLRTPEVIAVLDDGVDSSHPFLAGRIVAEACSAPDCGDDPYARNGVGTGQPCAGCSHGTHVAGIAAGSSATVKGVAPEASIASIRVLSPSGGTWEGLANALDYVQNALAPRLNIVAVNMSIVARGYRSTSDCDAAWPSQAFYINGLRQLGILSTVSSGNDGFKDGISAPACIRNAISVAPHGLRR
jgi:subtilisin family serine protease